MLRPSLRKRLKLDVGGIPALPKEVIPYHVHVLPAQCKRSAPRSVSIENAFSPDANELLFAHCGEGYRVGNRAPVQFHARDHHIHAAPTHACAIHLYACSLDERVVKTLDDGSYVALYEFAGNKKYLRRINILAA